VGTYTDFKIDNDYSEYAHLEVRILLFSLGREKHQMKGDSTTSGCESLDMLPEGLLALSHLPWIPGILPLIRASTSSRTVVAE